MIKLYSYTTAFQVEGVENPFFPQPCIFVLGRQKNLLVTDLNTLVSVWNSQHALIEHFGRYGVEQHRIPDIGYHR